MAWCFVTEESCVRILDVSTKERSSPVFEVKEGPSRRLIQVKFLQGELKFLDMKNFKAMNDFSAAFTSVLESRQSFVKTYRENVQRLGSSELSEPSTSSKDDSSNVGDLGTSTILDSSSTRPSCPVAREKILADCLKVHVKNLRPPSEEKLVRPLNLSHVEKLREEFLSRGKQFKILATVYVCGKLENAMEPGGVELEVIGGNHSRKALESLYSSGLLGSEVIVCVYRKDVTLTEALAVGYVHNAIDESSLAMSFLDKARVIRSIKKRSKKWSAEASIVFGFKSNAEARTKLRTMAALADVSEEVWVKVETAQQLWQEKKPLRQTAFTKFVGLDSEQQLNLMSVWIERGFKAYMTELNKTLPDKVIRQENSDREAEVLIDSTNKDMAEETRSLMKEIEMLKRENTKKEAAIKALEEENKQLKVEKTDHLKIIDSLRKEVKKRQLTESEEKDQPSKKAKYCVGEKVWAFYEPDNHLYPAKITDIEGSSYTVKFTEDGITATIAETELKKFTKK